MSVYARIYEGIVVEIIYPMLDDEERDIPIGERYTAEFVSDMVDVTDTSPRPDQRWATEKVDGTWRFTPPN